MITIDLTTALALYSAILGLGVLAIWLYTALTVQRPQRALGKQFLWRCSFCTFVYLDEENEAISQCPRCESFNQAADRMTRAPGLQATPAAPRPPAPEEEAPRRNPAKGKRPGARRRGPRRRR